MRAAYPSLVRRATGMALIASVCACGSSPSEAEPDRVPEFEGSYALSGTYDGRTHGSAEGSIVVSGQSGTTATADISVILRDNGNVFFALNRPFPGISATSAPRQATLEADGSFSVTFSGREVIDGIDPASCCDYEFKFEGQLSGDQLAGRWSLTRDMPSFDSGTLTAIR